MAKDIKPCQYFVWREDANQPYRLYSSRRRHNIPAADDERCIWRGTENVSQRRWYYDNVLGVGYPVMKAANKRIREARKRREADVRRTRKAKLRRKAGEREKQRILDIPLPLFDERE